MVAKSVFAGRGIGLISILKINILLQQIKARIIADMVNSFFIYFAKIRHY